MEGKTVLTASVTGTVTPKDTDVSEAFKITVVYSDGSKAVLRKQYDEFVDLQVKVYDLLNQKGGYSKKTARSLISSFPENNSALSRLLNKDSDLKKMGRIDEFIKELLTLPTEVLESDVIKNFFGQIGPIERFSEEDELKNVIKVAEKLGGRDPLRDLHVLTKEAGQLLYQKMNRLNERRPGRKTPLGGKMRAASIPDGVLDKKTADPRPCLQRRPFSVPADMADMFKESEELKKRKPTDDGVLDKKTADPRPGLQRRPFSVPVDMDDAFKESEELKKRKPADESSKHQSGSDESTAQQNSGIDPEHSEVETRSRNVSPQFGAMNSPGRVSPVRTKYVVIELYIAEEKGEVTLEEGEEVKVLQKETSGWWYVKNDFCEGWAPSTFLQPAVDSRSTSPEAPDQFDQPDNQNESCEIREKLDSCPSQPDDMEQEKRFVQQEKLKSLDRNTVKGPQTKTTQMNRRAKFLTVEGIQKRKNPDKNYVYILKVVWSDGNINIIYRTCSDFFFLQENLRKEFPTAIGKEIPALKGRKFTENCQFCFKDGTCKRQKFMNQFCHELVNAPDNISKGKAVMDFCRSRPSDVLPAHGESTKKDGKTTENNDDDNVQISGPVVFEQYIVTADYQKKNKNDISLTAGDIVDVIERNDYGWWLVDRDGELGWAPASHLEPTDDGAEVTSSKTFAPGQEEIYMSIKSYQARADDELSFDVDMMLKVVEKTLDGWWLVRYQGEEGWAPAMFLKRVDSGESSISASRKGDTLDIVSFDGDSENGDGRGISRTPPTRRSMVQRTVRRKPKRNSIELNEKPERENGDNKPKEAPGTKSSRSIPVPAKANTSPLNNKALPRSKGVSLSRMSPRPLSGEFSKRDLEIPLQSRQISISSSGYESSPTGSLSSLVSSDAFNEEPPTYGIKKCATLPRFDNIEDEVPKSHPSPAMPRSRSVTSMAHYKNEMELSLSGISSSGRKSSSGRSSPIRRSPLAGSPPRGRDSGYTSPFRTLPRDSSSEIESESQDESYKENFADSRFYIAMHTYISQEDGEVSFMEGDEIEVIQRNENGWWLVRTSEERGWGPSNFLQSLAY